MTLLHKLNLPIESYKKVDSRAIRCIHQFEATALPTHILKEKKKENKVSVKRSD
jgi:hypothetical protein